MKNGGVKTENLFNGFKTKMNQVSHKVFDEKGVCIMNNVIVNFLHFFSFVC